MSKIRVQNVIQSKPGCFQKLYECTLMAANYMQKTINIKLDIFCTETAVAKENTFIQTNMDFNNIEQYHEMYLNKLLKDFNYQKIMEQADSYVLKKFPEQIMAQIKRCEL